MSGLEKRRFVRIHFERKIQLDFLTEVYDKCQVKNISLGGMFVSGEFPPNLGGQCYVNLVQTAGKTSLTLEALALVVRQDDEGLALIFTSMSFESLLSLEMILLFQAREESTDTEVKLPKELPFEVCDEISCIPDKFNPLLDEAE